MKPEMTQGGGFTGGVFTGPGAAPPRSSLFELAEALGATGKSAVGGLVDDFGKRIETNKKTALDEAAIFEQTTAGYTSEMLRAEIESEPMAAKFKANPYLLPAINVYRGRKLADELGLRMVQEGIDTGDAEAVQAFYQNNAPDLSDPFYARGFNEQNARLQAQFSQQQLKDAITQAEQDRLAGAGEIWREAFFATGDVNLAKAAVDESVFGQSIDGRELAGIQFEFAKQLAVEGNIEMLDKLVNTKRGDAPSLAQDARYAGDVATLVAQASRNLRQSQAGERRAAQEALIDRIDLGMSWPSVEQSPEYLAMAEPGQAEGAMSQEQQEIKRAWRAKQDELKRKAEQEEVLIAIQAAQEAAEERAAMLVSSGQSYLVEDYKYDDGTGRVRKFSAASLRSGAVNYLRRKTLGDAPFSLKGEDARAYRTYTDTLSAGKQQDPQLKAALNGMASALTSSGLQENPESVLQAYEIYRNLSNHGRQTYVTDGRTRAILEKIDRQIQDHPQMDVLSAAKKAVSVAESGVRIQPTSKLVGTTASSIKLEDPINIKPWYVGGGNKKFTPDRSQVQDFLAERITDFVAFGMTPEEAAEAARKDAEQMFTVVNDVAVRLPEFPAGAGESAGIPTPKAWGEDVHRFLTAYGVKGKVPMEELRLTWTTGNQYALTRVTKGKDGVEDVEFLDNVYVGDILGVNYKATKEANAVASVLTTKKTPKSLEEKIDEKREKQRQFEENMARMGPAIQPY